MPLREGWRRDGLGARKCRLVGGTINGRRFVCRGTQQPSLRRCCGGATERLPEVERLETERIARRVVRRRGERPRATNTRIGHRLTRQREEITRVMNPPRCTAAVAGQSEKGARSRATGNGEDCAAVLAATRRDATCYRCHGMCSGWLVARRDAAFHPRSGVWRSSRSGDKKKAARSRMPANNEGYCT